MPRPARVKCETIFENLKDLPIFHEDGELKKRKDPVWTEAVRRMPEINLHNLYLFVYQDRRDIKTNLRKYKNLENPASAIPAKGKKKVKKEPVSNYNEIWDDHDYYETLDNESNPDALSDFDTLITIKESDQYKNTIHKIAVLPFSVIYWHPQQLSLWSDLMCVEPTVSLIVLDNIISNIKGSFESGNIYLYALALKLDSTIILLGEMMSDSVNSLEIQYFLDSWLQGGAPAPPEFVTGYSYSLLDAASLSFNFCSFDQYNLRCFRCLTKETIGLPPTLLQIDIISLIKVVNGWSCFENVAQSIKDLYLCSIMYLSIIDNIEEFKEAVISILVLCQSPYQNDEIESRRVGLWAQLTSETIQQMNQQYIQLVTGKNGQRSFSFYNIRQHPVISETPHDIYEYVSHLKQVAFDLCNFNTDGAEVNNDYYCPIVLENLIQLLIEFPSWTKIFVKKRECSTLVSTCAVKHLTTLTELKDPVSPPQFFMYHYEKLNSLMHQGRFTLNKIKNKIGAADREHKANHAHLTQVMTTTHETLHDSRIEINIPMEEEALIPIEDSAVNNEDISVQNEKVSAQPHVIVLDEPAIENAELDLMDLKSAVNAAIRSLLDFDEYVSNVLLPLIKPGQEPVVCKTLLDCCTEMKTYERFLGTIVERFCTNSDGFCSGFKTLFIECYNTVELLDKNELKNASRLFAHLLETDTIPWECFNCVKLNDKDMTTPKKNFIRILLRELSEHMGVDALAARFKDKEYGAAFRGLFPNESRKDIAFATSFFKSIGLKALGEVFKGNQKKAPAPDKIVADTSVRKRSPSVESVVSDDSCDFVFEIRMKKKNGKRCSSPQKRKFYV